MTDSLPIRRGCVVRVGNGRARWLVTRVAPEHGIALLRSERGRERGEPLDRLTVLEDAPPLDFHRDGSVTTGEKVIRGSDALTATAVEWNVPRGRRYTNEPSAVTASIFTDVAGRDWLGVSASGAGSTCNAYLTRETTLQLAADLLLLADKL